jgi:hypothetical protein
MFMILLPCLSLLLVAVLGCGEPTVSPDEAYDPEELQGTVDTTLPPDLQARQEAIFELFDALQRGVPIDMLDQEVSGISFQESEESFLGDTIRLERWEFSGKPSGSDVPVTLFLAKDDVGEDLLEQQRVYTVSGAPGRFSIRRK